MFETRKLYNVKVAELATQVLAVSADDAVDAARQWFYDRGIRDEAMMDAEVWLVS
jgi:hypothetical protein